MTGLVKAILQLRVQQGVMDAVEDRLSAEAALSSFYLFVCFVFSCKAKKALGALI